MKLQARFFSTSVWLFAILFVLVTAATTRADYSSIVLGDHPVAYYPLNLNVETTGNAADLSGNGNNGTYVNISPGFNNVPGPSSYITNGVSFDGSTTYVDLSTGGNPGLLNFGGTISMEAWVQPANTAENAADIVGKGYDSSRNYDELEMRADIGKYHAGTYNGTTGDRGVTGSIQTTNWTHLVSTYDGTNWNLYVNGSLVGSSPDSVGAINFSTPWSIGAGSADGLTRMFTGNISEVALYTTALTSAQVLTHYYQGKFGSTNPAPVITSAPASQTIYVGGNVRFSVSVDGLMPNYQWYKGTSLLTGQTNTMLTLTNLQLSDAGNYTVTITNVAGSITSAPAVLTVLAGPPPPPTVQNFWHLGEDGSTHMPADSVGSRAFDTGFGTANVDTNAAPGSTSSLSFGGNGGDYMNAPGISVPADNWVLEAWVYPTSISGPMSILTLGHGTGASQFGIENGKWAFAEFASAFGDNSQTVVTNTWTHLAWVRDFGVDRFFINGVQIGSDTASPVNDGLINLAVQPGDGRYFLGNVDEIRFSTFVSGGFTPSYLLYNVYGAPGPLKVTRSVGNLTITWTGAGTLQQSTNIVGPYSDLSGATSPFSIPLTNVAAFFRVKQ